MTPQLEALETIGHDIDEARTRIEAARHSLQDALNRDIDVPEFRQAIARPERMEAELHRVVASALLRNGLARRLETPA